VYIGDNALNLGVCFASKELSFVELKPSLLIISLLGLSTFESFLNYYSSICKSLSSLLDGK